MVEKKLVPNKKTLKKKVVKKARVTVVAHRIIEFIDF